MASHGDRTANPRVEQLGHHSHHLVRPPWKVTDPAPPGPIPRIDGRSRRRWRPTVVASDGGGARSAACRSGRGRTHPAARPLRCSSTAVLFDGCRQRPRRPPPGRPGCRRWLGRAAQRVEGGTSGQGARSDLRCQRGGDRGARRGEPGGAPDEWNRHARRWRPRSRGGPSGPPRRDAAPSPGGNTVSPLGDAVVSARPVPSPTPAAANTQIGGLFGLACPGVYIVSFTHVLAV